MDIRRLVLGLAVVGAVATAVFGVAGFNPLAAARSHTQTGAGTELVLVQSAPELVDLDLGEPGATHGDMLAYVADLSGENGLRGELQGLLLTVDLPSADGGDELEDRIGTLVFHLGADDTIIAQGGTVYPRAEREMQTETPQLRAVTGGTGAHIGARGQVTTTRNADGSYEHRFELLD